MQKQIILLGLSLWCLGCAVSKSAKTTSLAPATVGDNRIAFYNVENLFDTVDDPATPDEEFLPSSKKNWTQERYQTKLEHLAKVIEGMEFPALIGLAEVENGLVLQDFCSKTSLKAHDYGIVHFESPDFRGIDVALLYKKDVHCQGLKNRSYQVSSRHDSRQTGLYYP